MQALLFGKAPCYFSWIPARKEATPFATIGYQGTYAYRRNMSDLQ